MKPALTAGLLTYALFVQQAASTSWGNQPVFSNPEHSDNKCTVDQDKGFNWDKLPPGGFGDYGGMKFGGFDCKNSFQPKNRKRSLQARTDFKSKCIQGTVGKSAASGPKISSGDDKFSITSFDISVEFDVDLDFIFSMPDGSKCKHTAPCKAKGSTVKNTQCGGAKEVTFQMPPSNNKKDCDFGIHTMRFDCRPHTKTSTTTRATSTTTTTISSLTTTTTTTTPLTTTTEPLAPPPPPVTTTTTTKDIEQPPPPPVTTTTTTPIVDAPPPPVTTTTTTSKPDEQFPPPPETTTTTTSKPDEQPPPPPATTTTTTSKDDEQPPPPPVTTTTTSEGEQPPPPPVTTTTTTSKPDDQLPPPPPATTTTTSKPDDQPPPPPPATTTTTPLTTTTATTSTTPLTSFTMPPPDTSITTSTTTSSSVAPPPPPPPPPPPSSPCPPVLPRCLNTWLDLVGSCKSNSDSHCFCPSVDFIVKVQECVSAWSGSDSEITAALSYLAGICADYVPQNPGICTGIPPTITLIPQPPPLTSDDNAVVTEPATNGNGRGPRPPITEPPAGPVTVVTFTRTVDGNPVPTVVTVPQVIFITTDTPPEATAAPGAPAVPGVGLVPFAPALVTATATPNPEGPAGPAAAAPTGVAGAGTAPSSTGRAPDLFTGAASKQSIGFSVLVGVFFAGVAFLV